MPVLWPLALYFGLVLILVGGILGLSYVLGQKHNDHSTRDPYESGIPQTGSARLRFDAKFYLNAMFFVVFDLETMFVIAWAIAFRQVGWAGYIEMLIFILVLVAALVYLWRLGGLDWTTLRQRVDRMAALRRRHTTIPGSIQDSTQLIKKDMQAHKE